MTEFSGIHFEKKSRIRMLQAPNRYCAVRAKRMAYSRSSSLVFVIYDRQSLAPMKHTGTHRSKDGCVYCVAVPVCAAKMATDMLMPSAGCFDIRPQANKLPAFDEFTSYTYSPFARPPAV